MTQDPFTSLGRIVKTHGLKGEVSVKLVAGASLDALVGVEVWFTPPPPLIRTSAIESSRQGPKGPIVTLRDVDDIDDARALVGCELLARTADLPQGWEEVDEADDLLGMRIVDEIHGELGEVVDVIVTGANDVWVVDGPLGEILIPVIDEVVLSYDEESDTASVKLLPGLIDEDPAS